mgnify:CR=1 FL=1
MNQRNRLDAELQHILPGARLEETTIADARGLRLCLLSADYPQHELDAAAIRAIMDNPLYWVFCWASGQVLAKFLLDDPQWVQGKRVLDFGCGSGILAIAAALLGARIVYARDIDPQALEATRNNALRNEVADRVLTAPADGEIPGCDLLISNILAGTLMDLAPNFARALPGGARVVLSGILAEQAAAVIEAYSPWFGLQQLAEQDGWILLAGHRQETD